MQRLRATTFFARLVLAWFALTLGMSMAAPVVHPDAVQWICGGGSVQPAPQDGGGGPAVKLTLDCALCAPAVVPPTARLAALPIVRQAHALPAAPVRPTPAQGLVLTPPARGPPVVHRA